LNKSDAPQIHARVYTIDPFLVRFAYVLWILCALCVAASIFLLFFRPAHRLAAVTAFLALLFYKWGRNCYYNLRHDERDDSIDV
jgi:hypothetical protein